MVKGLATEVSKEEASLKKTGRSVEVLTLQQKALEERVRELERERKEAGSTMDTAHLKKLQTQVETFEKGLREWGERERGREVGREGGKERRREIGRKGGRERGRKGGREEVVCVNEK